MKLAVPCLVFCALSSAVGCEKSPSSPGSAGIPSEDLINYATALEHCKQVGRDAGTYSAYETCTKEHGL